MVVLKIVNLNMKTKDITVKEYAKWYGCSVSNVTKQIRKRKPLEGVLKVKPFGRFYLLSVDKKMNADTFTNGLLPTYKQKSS